MKDLFMRLTEHTELLDTPLPGQPLVESAGDRRVLIENHSGVTEYSAQRIVIKMKYGCLLVCGFGLELTQMTKEQLVISGRIDALTVCRRGKS